MTKDKTIIVRNNKNEASADLTPFDLAKHLAAHEQKVLIIAPTTCSEEPPKGVRTLQEILLAGDTIGEEDILAYQDDLFFPVYYVPSRSSTNPLIFSQEMILNSLSTIQDSYDIIFIDGFPMILPTDTVIPLSKKLALRSAQNANRGRPKAGAVRQETRQLNINCRSELVDSIDRLSLETGRTKKEIVEKALEHFILK